MRDVQHLIALHVHHERAGLDALGRVAGVEREDALELAPEVAGARRHAAAASPSSG